MNRRSLVSRHLVLPVILLLALACNVPIIPQTGSDETPSLGPPTDTVQPATSTATSLPSPTDTITIPPITPTNTVTATSTFIPITPTNTSLPIPCNRAQYVADVNYPDGTEIKVDTNFTKTWRITNTGSCTWTSGYKIIYVSGDQMGAPAETTLTASTVPPGSTVDISVSMKVPSSTGTYKGFYKIRSSDNIIFGIGSSGNDAFWVEIKATFITYLIPAEIPLHFIPTKTPTSFFRFLVPRLGITLSP